jgi:hypothetical protein
MEESKSEKLESLKWKAKSGKSSCAKASEDKLKSGKLTVYN